MGAEGRFEREFVAGVEKSGVKKSGVGPPQSRSFANSRASEDGMRRSSGALRL